MPSPISSTPSQASVDAEVLTIVIEGVMPDGKAILAEYDAVFPKGFNLVGVSSRRAPG